MPLIPGADIVLMHVGGRLRSPTGKERGKFLVGAALVGMCLAVPGKIQR